MDLVTTAVEIVGKLAADESWSDNGHALDIFCSFTKPRIVLEIVNVHYLGGTITVYGYIDGRCAERQDQLAVIDRYAVRLECLGRCGSETIQSVC